MNTYFPPGQPDIELTTGEFIQGQRRSDVAPTQTFFNLSRSSTQSRNASLNEKKIRNILTDYFVNKG